VARERNCFPKASRIDEEVCEKDSLLQNLSDMIRETNEKHTEQDVRKTKRKELDEVAGRSIREAAMEGLVATEEVRNEDARPQKKK
jgi:hypothetical protein